MTGIEKAFVSPCLLFGWEFVFEMSLLISICQLIQDFTSYTRKPGSCPWTYQFSAGGLNQNVCALSLACISWVCRSGQPPSLNWLSGFVMFGPFKKKVAYFNIFPKQNHLRTAWRQPQHQSKGDCHRLYLAYTWIPGPTSGMHHKYFANWIKH